eukprot:UC1_evm1s797
MAMFGFMNVYALRVNLSVAAVAMAREFYWSNSEKGNVLSAFFFGYICTQVLGGYVAARYGGKYVYGCGVLVTTLLTLLTPLVAHNMPALLALRVVEGFGEGVTYPAMHAIWSVWAPPLERSKLAAIGYSGAYLGTVIALPISGILAS